ncbi:Hypothetical_protein [Hexamita inflata]|uniref:Hypothetical_protein n=1 Tax=Hexamita inflata TaxID=28002 RepID=A0AA86NAZ7_9EUKA|nr:Hypothetical protein HINF_LOCUS3516 [Hexamita inflata]
MTIIILDFIEHLSKSMNRQICNKYICSKINRGQRANIVKNVLEYHVNVERRYVEAVFQDIQLKQSTLCWSEKLIFGYVTTYVCIIQYKYSLEVLFVIRGAQPSPLVLSQTIYSAFIWIEKIHFVYTLNQFIKYYIIYIYLIYFGTVVGPRNAFLNQEEE